MKIGDARYHVDRQADREHDGDEGAGPRGMPARGGEPAAADREREDRQAGDDRAREDAKAPVIEGTEDVATQVAEEAHRGEGWRHRVTRR